MGGGASVARSTTATREALIAHLRDLGWVSIVDLTVWAKERGLTVNAFSNDLRVLMRAGLIARRPTSDQPIYGRYEYCSPPPASASGSNQTHRR